MRSCYFLSKNVSRLTIFILAALFVSLAAGGCATRGNPINGFETERYAIIAKIAASADHSVALDDEGGVWVAGLNKYGQLGLGDEFSRATFARAKTLAGKKIVAIAAGYGNTFAVDDAGALWAAGLNNFGQLGAKDAKNKNSFVRAVNLANRRILAVSAGVNHALALDDEGRVFAAGLNNFGQLGLGDAKDRDRFVQVAAFKNIKIAAIATGYDHSFVIDETGAAWASGWNGHGQLGLGDAKYRAKFARVGSLEGKKIVAIGAGDYHSVAIDAEGKAYAAGWSVHGQLGLGDKTKRLSFVEIDALRGKKIVAIGAGGFHTIAIDDRGKVWGAGFNGSGALGLGDRGDRQAFVEINSLNGEKIVAVAAGSDHSVVLNDKGAIAVCGWNYAGEMGLGEDRRNHFAVTFERPVFSEEQDAQTP
ncbi:MAG: hypothetical protein LBF86_01335 [Helicobacteraceae bacterium]|nr:hypothetical protein [Helicobacteraceae bacterium]